MDLLLAFALGIVLAEASEYLIARTEAYRRRKEMAETLQKQIDDGNLKITEDKEDEDEN